MRKFIGTVECKWSFILVIFFRDKFEIHILFFSARVCKFFIGSDSNVCRMYQFFFRIWLYEIEILFVK